MNEHVNPAVEQDLAEQLLEQRLLTKLGIRDLQRRWNLQPVRSVHEFGSGTQAEHTLAGNPGAEANFHGVAIFNPTEMTIHLGFGAGGSIGAALIVPPDSGLVWPAEFQEMSITVDAIDAERLPESVIVLRLPYPPAQPMAFPYGAEASLYNPLTGHDEVQRTPSIWKPLPKTGETIKAEESKAVWTPGAGNRFRLLGFKLSEGAASNFVQLLDGGTPFFGCRVTAGALLELGPVLNGYLSTKAGNSLELLATAEAVFGGTFWGTEE